MKNSFLFISLISFAFIFISCDKGDENKEVALTSNRDSLSYSFGVNIASSMKQEGIDTVINLDIFTSGFNAVITNNNPALTSEQAMAVLQAYFKSIQEKESAKGRGEGEAFLAENAKKEGVITTASGLQYKVIKMGTGPKPTLESKVKTHYTGKLVDGKVFDSSEGNEPVVFPLNGVIQGWQEGIQLMPVGSKFEFYIPWNLAYGERGYPPTIAPYSALIFQVELLGIEKE